MDPADEVRQLRNEVEYLRLEAYQWRGYSKGARGIYMRLLHMEPPVVMNVKKIRRLMDKYNLSCPDEFYEFYITGKYPLKIENPPPVPIPEKPVSELGRTMPLKESGNGN